MKFQLSQPPSKPALNPASLGSSPNWASDWLSKRLDSLLSTAHHCTSVSSSEKWGQ